MHEVTIKHYDKLKFIHIYSQAKIPSLFYNIYI